ncbi:MAG: class I SAM-dependent methyltransferase [Cyanobacteria bacterium P01_G01_bin.39]
MNNTKISPENRYTDYDPWAWLYNETEAISHSLSAMRERLNKLLLPHLPQKAQILDLCCGTGQLTEKVLSKGYQVTGLDGSENMLNYARKNAPQGRFILDDARTFTGLSSFDAVYCSDYTLNHMMNVEDLKSVFNSVFNTLKKDGLFVFGLGLEKRFSNIDVDDGKLENDYAWTVGETYNPESKTGTFTITIFQPNRQNSNSQITQIDSIIHRLKCIVYNYFLRPIKPSSLLKLLKKSWQSSEIVYSVKAYSKIEVESALKEAGFTLVNIYNNKNKLASSTENEYACFVALRPT